MMKLNSSRAAGSGWKRPGAILALAVICIGGVACGGDDNGDNQNILANSGNQNDFDAGFDADSDGDAIDDTGVDADADLDADPDVDPDADTDVDPPDTNGEEDEHPVEISGPCGPMVDLGELAWGETALEVDFTEFDNELSTRCENEIGDVAAIYRFNLPSAITGVLEIESPQGVAAELRLGGCSDGADHLACYEDDFEMALQPGVIHHLVMKPLDTDAEMPMDVILSFEEMLSCPGEEGEIMCFDDSRIEACQLLQSSPDIPRQMIAECPSSECSEDRCAGDHCDAPISITSSFEWSGRNFGFSNHHNSIEEVLQAIDAEEIPTCVIIDEENDDATMFDTNGRELIFELENLEEGDEVQIEVSHMPQQELAILVKETCSDTSMCLEAWMGESEVTFVAPSDGNFFVIIDTPFDFDAHFDISIDSESF